MTASRWSRPETPSTCRPAHVPKAVAGTEFVQFSPTEQLDHVSRHMTENAKRMQGAGAPG